MGRSTRRSGKGESKQRRTRNSSRTDDGEDGREDEESVEEHMKRFNAALAPHGMYIKDVSSDGNCLFRAVLDQLQLFCQYHRSSCDCIRCEMLKKKHKALRRAVCDFMQEHEDDFAPFVEDNREFNEYVSSLREDGAWAGNMELQALSLLLGVNFRIYQLDSKHVDIENFPNTKENKVAQTDKDNSRCADEINIDSDEEGGEANKQVVQLRLSYHQQEHYASVRAFEDEVQNRNKRASLREERKLKQGSKQKPNESSRGQHQKKKSDSDRDSLSSSDCSGFAIV
mmetsp:Transcript_8952/g.16126  ORF Transcript_8952/g.16126 Transcript_8952/m.16126 type:complete len:284 (+) Transcript_8952:2009-2860(+)